MLKPIDWILIAAYIILIIWIGIRTKEKAKKSLADYFVSGRQLPWWLAGLSMVATTFAADTPLAVTELVRKNGISGNWLWWNFLIGGMLTTFFFSKLWRRSEVLTELELINIRYSGKKAKYLRILKSVYIGLFLNSLIIAWVNKAMLNIVEGFFDLDFQSAFLIVSLLFFIAVIYSTVSGLWGVAITDAIQFFIAISGSIILAVFVINSDKIGGIEALKNSLNSSAFYFFPKIGFKQSAEILTISFGSFLAYLLIQWWASWYPGAEPGGGGYIAQRMLSTKNEKHSFLATLFFQIAHYILRPFPWILVGLASFVLYPNLTAEQFSFGYVYAMRDFLPTGFKGLMLVAFFAAYMSTISTQLNFGSSLITNDFILTLKESVSEKSKVFFGRLATLLLAVISLFITTKVKAISDVWHFLLECGAGLGFVLIARWYWWRINAWSEITATLTPFVVFAIAKIYNLHFPLSYFLTVGITIFLTILITFLTKPTDIQILKNFYQKVKPNGFWKIFDKNSKIDLNLIWAWLSSVIFLYSVLFLIGKLIFHYWLDAILSILIALASFSLMWYFSKKAKVF